MPSPARGCRCIWRRRLGLARGMAGETERGRFRALGEPGLEGLREKANWEREGPAAGRRGVEDGRLKVKVWFGVADPLQSTVSRLPATVL